MMGWSVITIGAYLAALWLYRRSGHHLLCLPVLTGTALVLGALALAHTPYPVYAQATHALRWLSGPAIMALAVPLYRQGHLLRRWAGPLMGALLVGCCASVLGTVAVGALMGTPAAFTLSMAPKAATMPMAMQAAERAGGVAAVAAMAVVATGVLGTLLAGPVFRLLGVEDPRVRSFSLGLVAHAIGVARVMQIHPEHVAFAALAMGLNGLATALVVAGCSLWW